MPLPMDNGDSQDRFLLRYIVVFDGNGVGVATSAQNVVVANFFCPFPSVFVGIVFGSNLIITTIITPAESALNVLSFVFRLLVGASGTHRGCSSSSSISFSLTYLFESFCPFFERKDLPLFRQLILLSLLSV